MPVPMPAAVSSIEQAAVVSNRDFLMVLPSLVALDLPERAELLIRANMEKRRAPRNATPQSFELWSASPNSLNSHPVEHIF